MKKTILFIILIIYTSVYLIAQTSSISGTVSSTGDEPIISATVQLVGTKQGTYTNNKGMFKLNEVPLGSQSLKFSSIGYKDTIISIVVKSGVNEVKIQLEEGNINFDEIVVTGTRTAKRRTDSPVIVNLINSKELDHVVAINLSEGLKYQPGLRVETDCQTCNYTQLRMNGLQGGYSQILVNSRPIFSPLTGLYGLEQIPVNMIERIEVVRGGVSALYGSSAIGGTVNVILSANATVLNEMETAGATFFVSNRTRGAYDANGDNYSELPELKDNSFGTNLFFQINNEQKLSLSLSSINEYRYGGEMVEGPAYLAKQSEERTHNVFMGSMDYQLDFNNYKNTLAIYYGGQKTDRDHYTGINPDGADELTQFFAKPPYGTSDVVTHQGGFQLNNRLDDFIYGNAVLSVGAEYIYDDVYDIIETYNYLIDQTTTDFGAFFQYDWSIVPEFNLLTGVRLDKHNLVDKAILSPRVSVLYKWQGTTQFRLGWGTGFRAPQAFDTDLHIAFAGGGVSRISLADNLKEERSNSYTASVNYDKATEHFIAGFTLEGFYTTLDDAFYQFPLGEDEHGQRFEKRNGSGATVKGITIEARANFDYLFEVEAGLTVQSSLFDDAIDNIKGLPTKREFLRTPNDYGYATLTYNPSKLWNISANMTYTGTMELAHFGGENTGQLVDEYFTSPTFIDMGLRVGHTFELSNIETGLELFGGVKNIFDAYQNDFDVSKNRDSNYIYGPSLPRTMFVGIRVKPI
jgi:outer membrane receptor for ferrienterochelin and colicins